MSQKKANSKGCVYIAILRGEKRACKIGFTKKDPEKRVGELSSDYGGAYFDLYAFVKCDSPSSLESQVHRFLNRAKIEREVFSITPNSALRVVKVLVGRNFSVIDESNVRSFSCVSLDTYNFFNLNCDMATSRANKFLRKNNIRTVSDIFERSLDQEFEKFVTKGA